ncbi:DHA1 family tetracycline resistance protein-like MFS transporter [Mucilaginibacter yixingensis]|uniref:DHA1 family tetracycline resistance protein-like MFS transporter n=1 Tax=Mucilaginibacter yixingensis TaxID=1295612 RepID=A0A2T5JAF8_9SPHI|nr:TCR/Tet family MFS transporter [Mucilaginibacter yixingensis]PTQ97038.1 DHA1 family tetracycline resistance protein-like MFS transporter [Mucilaginibacter yixingensis]
METITPIDLKPPKQSAALGFIFVTLFIDVLGLGIIIPVIPKLLEQLGHFGNAVASEYNGWLTFIYASMQFVFSPLLGNLSDRFGRRPVLLISLFGFSIDYLFMAFAPSIFWLFVGRTIAGITGATMATGTAYIADVSTGDKRSANFGLVGAASGLGFIIGISAGAFLGDMNIKFPFIAAAAAALINALWGFFVLPESLDAEHRRPFEWKRALPWGTMKSLGKYKQFAGLALAFTLVYIAQKAIEYQLSFYVYEKFNWSMTSVGILGFFIGILLVGIQGGLIRIIIPRWGMKRTVISGLIFYFSGLLLMAFAARGWQVYAFMIPYCLGGISGPALQGFISSKFAKNEQGELQGGLTLLSSISLILGPLLMGYIFKFFTQHNASSVYFPGSPYIFGALLMLISIVLVIRSFRKEGL